MLKQILLRKLANQSYILKSKTVMYFHTQGILKPYLERVFFLLFFIYKIKVNLVNFFYKIHVKFLHSEGYINQVT